MADQTKAPETVSINIPAEAFVFKNYSLLPASTDPHNDNANSPFQTSDNSNSPTKSKCTPEKELDSGTGNPKRSESESENDPADVKSIERKGKKIGIFVFLLAFESAAFACAGVLLIMSFKVDKLHEPVFWDLGLWKLCLLISTIICGRLISQLFTNLILFLIWRFWVNERALYFGYGIRKSVLLFVWVGLVALAWGLIVDRGVDRSKYKTDIVSDVTRGLVGCLIGAFLWLMKTLLVKLVGSIHATKLLDKTKEAICVRKFLLALLMIKESNINGDCEKQEGLECHPITAIDGLVDRIANKLLEKIFDSDKQDEDGTARQAMKELMYAIRGKKLYPLPHADGKNDDGDDKKPDEAAKEAALDIMKRLLDEAAKEAPADVSGYNRLLDEEAVADITNRLLYEAAEEGPADIIGSNRLPEKAAKEAAAYTIGSKRYIFLCKILQSVKEKKVIDQLRGLAESKTKQDKSKTEDKPIQRSNQQNTTEVLMIEESVFTEWMVEVYREHDSLNSTLKHSKTAIDELNVIASVIVVLIVIVMWLLFMGFLTTKVLVFLSSQLLLAVFMFGNSVKTVFEAVIFVFLVHPFDVGDRCVINGIQMVVDEMNILTTTFLRFDNEKIYYPNAVLASKPISNLYRSPPMSEIVEFSISLHTPEETIEKLQERIKEYLEENPRWWRPDHSLQFREIENVNKMKLALFVNHTINFHYIGKRFKRRSGLVLKMKYIFEELKIEYNLLPQQVNLTGSVRCLPQQFD